MNVQKQHKLNVLSCPGVKEIFFQSRKGRIYGLYYESSDENAPVLLILHGHPKNQLGSYNTPIIQSVFKAAMDNNYSVLAINYRGCGKSTGKYLKEGDGLIDASLALDWLHNMHPNNYKFWVAGFSYGSWVAAQLATRRPEIVGFVLISMLLFQHDYSFLTPFPCLGLIIHGDMDSATKFKDIKQFFNNDIFTNHQNKINIQKIYNGDHFFYHTNPITTVDPEFIKTCYDFFNKNKDEETQIPNFIQNKSDDEGLDDNDDDYDDDDDETVHSLVL